ncbi:MAG: hypothetical protein RLZZ244_1387 [Verrucomicrobiota bacterium]|jgi:hypothetical protein
MFFRSSGKSPSKAKPAPQETPFEARRRSLAEQEAALKALTEKHQRFIESAPKIAAERQRQQREMFLRNAASAEGARLHGAVKLPDSRYLHNDVALPTSRSRRREREKGKWMFLVLVFALIVAALWAWQTLFHPAF